MGKMTTGARVLLGLVFFVFGLNGFFNFLRVPPMAPAANAFMSALAATHYMMFLLKITEIVCGAYLLFHFMVPLALVMLAPIIVNIFCFHLFLDPHGLPVALVIVVLYCYLAFANRRSFSSLFSKGA